MNKALTRTLLFTLLAGFLTAGPSPAAAHELIKFNLSLAGYSLGMSYDEAQLVRPLNVIEGIDSDETQSADIYLDAYVKQVYIDDIEIDLRIRFKNARIYKILAHFPPEKTANFIEIFNRTLGKGENKSRNLLNRDGHPIRHRVHFWDYPNATLHLIMTSENNEFATIGLLAKPAYAETFVKAD